MAVIHDGLATPRVPSHHHDDRQHRTNGSDEHQNPSDLVDVEAVLVGLCDCPVKDGPDRKRNDTDDKSSSSDHADPFQLVAMAVPEMGETKQPIAHRAAAQTKNHVIDRDARCAMRDARCAMRDARKNGHTRGNPNASKRDRFAGDAPAAPISMAAAHVAAKQMVRS
jgi:hypothetical protein